MSTKKDSRGQPVPTPTGTTNPSAGQARNAAPAKKPAAAASSSPSSGGGGGLLGAAGAALQPQAQPPQPTAPQNPGAITDPREFQRYLNAHGAKPQLVVDGKIGPLTLGAAAALKVDVPVALQPKPKQAATRSSAPPAPGNAPTASTDDTPHPNLGSVDDQIHAAFGGIAWAYDDPELRPIFEKAITEGWVDPDTHTLTTVGKALFDSEVLKTQVWQHTDGAQRAWRQLRATDNATALGQIASTSADIIASGAGLGIAITQDRANQLAEQQLSNGWTSDSAQVKNAIGAEFHYQPGAQSGTIGRSELDLRKLSADYLTPLSDATLADWEGKIARGEVTDPQVFKQYFVDSAKRRFPTLSVQLDAGATVSQLAEPYKQKAATVLGINPNTIDLNDAKWTRPLSTFDVRTGEFTQMNDYDWEKTLKTDSQYGWQYSKPGKDAALQFSDQFLRAIGRIPQ